MPQMSPMNWTLIIIVTLMTFMMVLSFKTPIQHTKLEKKTFSFKTKELKW